eukprot:NODE_596_length_5578_cov_0.509400.p2 type:complete len:365 gc:universal NODE_596_length_5578_cov_0.509400:5104-4010(-)
MLIALWTVFGSQSIKIENYVQQMANQLPNEYPKFTDDQKLALVKCINEYHHDPIRLRSCFPVEFDYGNFAESIQYKTPKEFILSDSILKQLQIAMNHPEALEYAQQLGTHLLMKRTPNKLQVIRHVLRTADGLVLLGQIVVVANVFGAKISRSVGFMGLIILLIGAVMIAYTQSHIHKYVSQYTSVSAVINKYGSVQNMYETFFKMEDFTNDAHHLEPASPVNILYYAALHLEEKLKSYKWMNLVKYSEAWHDFYKVPSQSILSLDYYDSTLTQNGFYSHIMIKIFDYVLEHRVREAPQLLKEFAFVFFMYRPTNKEQRIWVINEMRKHYGLLDVRLVNSYVEYGYYTLENEKVSRSPMKCIVY